jgi:hypothetical protein
MFDLEMIKMLEQDGFAGKPAEYMLWLTLKYPAMPHRQPVEKLRAFCRQDPVTAMVMLDQMFDEITPRLEPN